MWLWEHLGFGRQGLSVSSALYAFPSNSVNLYAVSYLFLKPEIIILFPRYLSLPALWLAHIFAVALFLPLHIYICVFTVAFEGCKTSSRKRWYRSVFAARCYPCLAVTPKLSCLLSIFLSIVFPSRCIGWLCRQLTGRRTYMYFLTQAPPRYGSFSTIRWSADLSQTHFWKRHIATLPSFISCLFHRTKLRDDRELAR
jgi:hypothetical protein